MSELVTDPLEAEEPPWAYLYKKGKQLSAREEAILVTGKIVRESALTPVVYAVYYLGRTKIGMTRNVAGLMVQYHRIVPDAQLIWVHPGGRELEKKLHRMFPTQNLPHLTGRNSEVFLLGKKIDAIVQRLDAAIRDDD